VVVTGFVVVGVEAVGVDGVLSVLRPDELPPPPSAKYAAAAPPARTSSPTSIASGRRDAPERSFAGLGRFGDFGGVAFAGGSSGSSEGHSKLLACAASMGAAVASGSEAPKASTEGGAEAEAGTGTGGSGAAAGGPGGGGGAAGGAAGG
jgi:hypothetical protein